MINMEFEASADVSYTNIDSKKRSGIKIKNITQRKSYTYIWSVYLSLR